VSSSAWCTRRSHRRRLEAWSSTIDTLLTPGFWWLVAAAYVLTQVALPVPRSLRFAIVNGTGISLIFGWDTFATLLALAAGLWLLLRPAVGVRRRGWAAAAAAASAIALLIAVFVAYKLGYGLDASGAERPDAARSAYRLLRAVSFSYVFLRAVDLVRAVTWGGHRLLDPLSLTGFLGPFHMLLSGPVTPYAEHVAGTDAPAPAPTFTHLTLCAQTIVTGLFMKVVIAQSLKIFRYGAADPIAVGSWWDTAYLMLYLFFDFGGYSLMALGIGRLLAVPTSRNFDRPFLASTVTDFWARWHMSLGIFLRNNLFLPIQLFVARRLRRRALATVAALVPLAVSFISVGAWHRISIRFTLWGAAMAIVMTLEKLVRDYLLGHRWGESTSLRNVWRVAGPVYTQVVIITGIHFVAREIFVS
jgi:membrane protein involved in D-alanine export